MGCCCCYQLRVLRNSEPDKLCCQDVASKCNSGLCLSNDGQTSQSHASPSGGTEFLRSGSVRTSHHGPGGSPSLGGGEGGTTSLRGASLEDGGSRFPRLDQCAHFHYEYVELPSISVCLVSEDLKPLPRGTSRSASVDSKRSSEPDSHSSFTDGIIGSLAAECENYIDGAVGAEDDHQNNVVDPENKENTELVVKTTSDAQLSGKPPRPGVSQRSCVAEVHADSSALPSDVSRNSKPDGSPSTTLVVSASKGQPSSSVVNKVSKAPDVSQSTDDSESKSFLVQVTSLGRSWVVRRTYENFRFLDRQLHRCCYDRKVSRLSELPPEDQMPVPSKESTLQCLASAYLAQLSNIAGPLITCGPVLGWLELDNRGHRLIVTDDSDINTPAVAAAYVVKRYVAQASDEISFEAVQQQEKAREPLAYERKSFDNTRKLEKKFRVSVREENSVVAENVESVQREACSVLYRRDIVTRSGDRSWKKVWKAPKASLLSCEDYCTAKQTPALFREATLSLPAMLRKRGRSGGAGRSAALRNWGTTFFCRRSVFQSAV
ncbi:Phoxous domain [Trinorchestia longiramus]|nr:Phoxous domain [Trinorchestia longiramus]